MQENTKNIFEMGILASEVYDNNHFFPGNIIINDDLQYDYNVIATHNELLGEIVPDFFGFEALLLEEQDSSGNGTGNFVIAFRGTEFPAFWQTIADFASDGSMALGNFTMQMEFALMFVKEALSQFESEGLSTNNLTFTGHSLGGSLAELAGYTFGCETYTYNPFGVDGVINGLGYTNFLVENRMALV